MPERFQTMLCTMKKNKFCQPNLLLIVYSQFITKIYNQSYERWSDYNIIMILCFVINAVL